MDINERGIYYVFLFLFSFVVCPSYTEEGRRQEASLVHHIVAPQKVHWQGKEERGKRERKAKEGRRRKKGVRRKESKQNECRTNQTKIDDRTMNQRMVASKSFRFSSDLNKRVRSHRSGRKGKRGDHTLAVTSYSFLDISTCTRQPIYNSTQTHMYSSSPHSIPISQSFLREGAYFVSEGRFKPATTTKIYVCV